MKVRSYQGSDVERIHELFVKQGFEYTFPDANVFCVAHVVEEDGVPQMAVFARPTVELYLLADREWGTPGMKLEAFKALHESVRRELDKQGYEDANAWLPPQICRAFGRRLRKLGWFESKWQCFSRLVRQ